MNYSPHWDLTTIPDDVWASEVGRRTRPHAPNAPKLKLCSGGCKTFLTATQRRKPCPTCGTKDPGEAAVAAQRQALRRRKGLAK